MFIAVDLIDILSSIGATCELCSAVLPFSADLALITCHAYGVFIKWIVEVYKHFAPNGASKPISNSRRWLEILSLTECP